MSHPDDGTDKKLPSARVKDLVLIANDRCGRSESCRRVIKKDFAGGMMPSGFFGSNRWWFHLPCLNKTLDSLFHCWAILGDDVTPVSSDPHIDDDTRTDAFL